jgi:hypothetical protein
LAARSNSDRCRTAIAPEGGTVMARRIVRRKGEACGVRESDRRGWASCAGPHNHNTRLSPDDVAFGSGASFSSRARHVRLSSETRRTQDAANGQPWVKADIFSKPSPGGRAETSPIYSSPVPVRFASTPAFMRFSISGRMIQ